jgi:hypothetical protein
LAPQPGEPVITKKLPRSVFRRRPGADHRADRPAVPDRHRGSSAHMCVSATVRALWTWGLSVR